MAQDYEIEPDDETPNVPDVEAQEDDADEKEKKEVARWLRRTAAADKVHEEWADQFQCDTLEKYYEGDQKRMNQDAYVLNNFFPAVEARLPQLMFKRPRAFFSIRPAKEDVADAMFEQRALLLGDIANHFMQIEECGFREETLLAVKESLYRFGVIEVGYSANYVDNPHAGKPKLDEKGGALTDENGPVLQPDKIAEYENLFIRRIPADKFRFPAVSANKLQRNDWCGYFEYVYVSDIKNNPYYADAAKDEISEGGETTPLKKRKDDADGDEAPEGKIKLWRIWDIRLKVRQTFVDGGKHFLEKDEPFDYLPFAILKFYERLDTALPVPWLSNAVDPQDEMNEGRTMMRAHRRRFVRRYAARKNAIDTDQLEKLTGEPKDGEVIFENETGALRAIEDASLGMEATRSVPDSQADFMRITGIGGEAQGVADSDTATQANIIQTNSQNRDDHAREIVGKWLGRILWLIVKTAKDNFTLPWLVKTQIDLQSETAPDDIAKLAATWQSITSEDIPDLEFDVDVDLESLSPNNEMKKREQWTQVLSLFKDPALMQVLAASDTMLRKTLGFYGVRTEREIQDVKQTLLLVVMQQIQQAIMAEAAKSLGGMPGAAGSSAPQPTPGPTPADQIANIPTGQVAGPTAA